MAPMALIALPWCAASAETADSGSATQLFSLSGFGTLGLVRSSEDRADFTSSVFQPGGAGYPDSWSAAVDSLIGAQLTVNINPKLSAVVQIIAQQNYNNTYTPHVEWANVKYLITPDFSIRVGRTVMPTFFVSDSVNVGYTMPWVRPPREIYQLLPIDNSDGVDLSYRLHIGAVTDTLQGNYGQNSSELPYNRGSGEGRHLWGLSNTAEYGPLTVHLAYQELHLTIASFNALFDGFRQFGPQGIAIADEYDVDDKALVTETIGARYDPGHYFVMGEWARANTNSVFAVGTAWYVSGGYRFGTFTPYLNYAEVKTDRNSDPGLALAGLPPKLAGFAAGLNAGLNSILELNPDQNTVSVGSRWDFMRNVDLKLQIDHSRHGPGSSGELTNLQPGFRPGGEVNLFSATVDFVF
jgi:Gram-negative porin